MIPVFTPDAAAPAAPSRSMSLANTPDCTTDRKSGTQRGLLSRARVAVLATATVAGLCAGNLATGPSPPRASRLRYPPRPPSSSTPPALLKALELPQSSTAPAPVPQARVVPEPALPAPPRPAGPRVRHPGRARQHRPAGGARPLGTVRRTAQRGTREAAIDTPLRNGRIHAQLVVESDSFRTFEEYASGRAYEGARISATSHPRRRAVQGSRRNPGDRTPQLRECEPVPRDRLRREPRADGDTGETPSRPPPVLAVPQPQCRVGLRQHRERLPHRQRRDPRPAAAHDTASSARSSVFHDGPPVAPCRTPRPAGGDSR